MTLLVLYLALLFAYGLLSARLERTVLTGPILFTLAGALAASLPASDRVGPEDLGPFLGAAELGLVLLLFTDASRTDLRALRAARSLPIRLLSTGMLLTLAAGAMAAWVCFPHLGPLEMGVLAAILAPTDAGLGQVIVTDPRVPGRIRQALNVEAGLNDGLSVPFLLFFLALLVSHGDGERAGFLGLLGEQLGYGTLVGGGIGLVGGRLLGLAARRGWTSRALVPLAVVSLPLLAFATSEAVGASMFIAAFVAGLTVQRGYPEAGKHSVELAEEWGQIVNLAVFFLFGVIAMRALPDLGSEHAVYAVLSLTVVRMLPVWVALWGTRLSGASVLFMGWFGPRGLASIVLGLVYLEHQAHLPDTGTIRLAVVVTVLASVLLHGLSARPGIRLYERRVARLSPDAPEREES